VIFILAINSILSAQTNGLHLVASAGRAPFDLSGTGTGTLGALELDIPVTSFLIIEPGVRYFKYDSQSNQSISHLLTEISLQLQIPVTFFNPYFGVGTGFSTIVDGRNATNLTLHAALGVRIRLQPKWKVRTEARLRSIDPWIGNTFDLTIGISRVLY